MNFLFNKKIKIKVSLVYSDGDRISTMDNINDILTNLDNVKPYYLKNWGHATYLWGINKEILYKYFDEIFA